MEVLLGLAFTFDVPSSPPHSPPNYDGDPPTIDEAGKCDPSTSFSGDGSAFRVGGQLGFFFGNSSESSSSIGTPDDNDDENDDDVSSQKEEEAESTLKGLGSLDSLEDSLPIKRGLSSHFSGKSKSFTDLSQVSSMKDLQKQENPLNKRRRVQIASKWLRRSSFYAYSNPKSMPLLPLNEDSESEEEVEEKDREVSPSPRASSSILADEKKLRDEVNRVPLSYAVRMRHRLGSFKSRSLSLADLQEHDEEEKEEDDDDD